MLIFLRPAEAFGFMMRIHKFVSLHFEALFFGFLHLHSDALLVLESPINISIIFSAVAEKIK
jgi:hypothetical protein